MHAMFVQLLQTSRSCKIAVNLTNFKFLQFKNKTPFAAQEDRSIYRVGESRKVTLVDTKKFKGNIARVQKDSRMQTKDMKNTKRNNQKRNTE